MAASFNNFKLEVGIKNAEKDTEYASILKSLIKELYTTYGIALTRDIETTTETINSTFDTTIQLAYKNIVSLNIDGYSEGDDYLVDYNLGELTIISTGSMLEDTDYPITYDYYVFINESNEILYTIYPETDELIYHIDIKPFTLNSVSYNGIVLVENTDYYLYNNKFEVVTAVSTDRIPFILNLKVGYDDIPQDLKRAFYELASIRFDMKENKTYLVSKTSDNASGMSTTYRLDSTPQHIKQIFEEYTGRRFMIW